MTILNDIRVIEVGTYIFGPAAATVMSDFGAEIIKVEPPGGDPYRNLYLLPPLPACERNYCFMLDGRNKKSIVIDLRQEAGREILIRLVRTADVFLTNYHASVLNKLRISYEDLAPENPRLIYAHATGYGEVGDEIEKPGFDMTAYWARSGLMDTVRDGDDEPSLAPAGMGDHPASIALFSAILLGLYDRMRTGRGTKVSTSLMANGAWANSVNIQAVLCGGDSYRPRPRAEACSALVNHYKTRDGKRFILCCINTARDWPALCRAVGRTDLLTDSRFATAESRVKNSPALIAIFDSIFESKTMDEWKEIFVRHEVTFGPVPPPGEIPNDEQMKINKVFVPIENSPDGDLTVNTPMFLQGIEKTKPRLAPEMGEHTREIIESLGLNEMEIEILFKSNTVFEASKPAKV